MANRWQRHGASLALAAGLVMALAGCASSGGDTSQAVSHPLVGTWRLVSFDMELQSSGERIQPMGKSPVGYLSFTPEGRMAVVITAEGRKPPATDQERAALYASLVAYTGRVKVEGNQWVTTVDASANPAWVGTQQPRTFKISGSALQETSPWFPRADRAMVRVMNVYERVK